MLCEQRDLRQVLWWQVERLENGDLTRRWSGRER
jgi:hypothetical protein